MGVSSLTAAGFVGFYSLYTRAFTSFTEIPIHYRSALATSCLAALLILALLLPRMRRQLPAWAVVAGVLMAGAFALQGAMFSEQAETSTLQLVIAASVLMGTGYALYWALWVCALSHRPPSLALRCIAAGTAVGVASGSIPVLLPLPDAARVIVYSAVRFTLLALSIACLYRELRRECADESFDRELAGVGHARHLVNEVRCYQPAVQRYVLFPVSVYLVIWFTLYAGRYHREANAAVGIWVLLASSLAICALLVLLSRYENESLQFLDLLGDVLLFLGLSLDLLFVASAESDELFWTGSLFSNCLVDIVIMGKMASLRRYGGLEPGRVACLVLAVREFALLLGMAANRAVEPRTMAIANTLLVSTSLVAAAVFIALKTYGVIRERVADANRAARAFARTVKADRDLTDRESEVLEELLEGTSYRAIAQLLGISESTVKTHVTHIYSKLGAENRDGLIAQYKEFRHRGRGEP